MSNRLVTVILVVAVSLAVLVEGGRGLTTPQGRWREWLQLLAAQQIADTLGRQVRLGAITDVSVDAVAALDLAIAEGFYLADGAVVRAEQVQVDLNGLAIARGDVAPAAGIDRVVLQRAWVHAVRDEQGELNLEKLLPEPVKPVRPEDRFRGVVDVVDSTVIYDDYATPTLRGTPLSVELAEVSGKFDARRIGWAKISLSATERLGRVEQLAVEGETELDSGFAWAYVTATGVDGAWWFDAFVGAPEIELERATADLTATVGLLPTDDGVEPSVAGSISVRGASLRLAALGDRQITADLDATGTMVGVEIQRLGGSVGGVRVEASGFLGDFADPVIDVSFEAQAPRAEALLDLASDEAELPSQIAGVEVTGPVLASGRLTGPLGAANLSARLSAPGQVRFADADLGTYETGPIDLRLDVLDLLAPNVRAQATVADLAPVDLEPLRAMLPPDLQGEPRIGPIERLQAEVLWSDQVPLVQTELAVPSLSVGELAVSGVSADLALAGPIVWVRDLHAEALGAQVSADAVLDLSEPATPWAWARGEIAGLDLQRLDELPGLQAAADAGGVVSGSFVARLEGEEPLMVAQLVVAEPSYEQYGVASARGIVIVDAAGVQVRAATIQDPVAAGWVRGVLPFEGELAASFGVAGVDLAAAVRRFDVEADELRGQLFAHGEVGGTLDDPRVDATVRAFDLGWGKYSADAVVGEIRGGPTALRIDDLYASSGRIVAHATGALTAIDLQARDAAIQGSVTLAGPMDERALELADLTEHDLAGAVRADIDVGGTLRHPNAQGEVHLDYAHYETVATDNAVMVVRLQGDVLELQDLRLPVGEAVVTGEASVASLYGEPIVAATLRAERVVLQDLAPWQELQVPLSGELNLPYLSVTGPLDDLNGIAQIEATDLELGGQQIGSVSATVVLDGNSLMLQRTTLALADGTMSLEGRVRVDERRIMPSRVELNDVSVARLLRVVVPLAERFVDRPPDERAPAERPLSRQLASLAMRLGGRMNASVSVEGVIPELPEEPGQREAAATAVLEALSGEATVALSEPTLDGKPLPDTKLAARVADEPVVDLSLTAEQGEALITADGTWRPGGAVDLLADISALEVASLRPWLPGAAASAGGRLNLTVQVLGSLDAPQITGSVDILEPELYGAQFDIISAPIFRYDGEALNIDSLVMREGEEELFVDGRIPLDWASRTVPADAPLAVTARAEETDLGVFPAILAGAAGGGEVPLAQVKATGTLDSRIEIRGTPQRPELTGELTVLASSIETPWLGSPIEDLALAVTFTGVQGKTVVELEKLSARAHSTTLTAGGRAELSEYHIARLQQNRYDLQVSLAAPQQSFGGGLTARKVRGTVTLETTPEGRQLLTVEDLGADFGDGSVLLDGTAELTTFEPSRLAHNSFDMVLRAHNARLRYSNLFLGTVNGEIVARTPAPAETMQITGGLVVSHAVVGVPRGGREEEMQLRGMTGAFPSPELDVALAIGPDVRVRTSGVAAPVQMTERAVWLRGTPQRPTIQGLIEVQEGQASMPGGVLDIETAGVRFLVRPALGSGGKPPPVPLEVEGRVWATATRRIEATVINGRQMGAVEILLQVSGTLPNNIYIQASSTPPLAEEQIYALLGTVPLGGDLQLARASDLEGLMTEQFVSALGLAVRRYVFQPFEEELRELLGLSVLEVSWAFDQPASVRIGGYLVENLLITYNTSVMGASETYDLEVSYRVEQRFQVGFSTNEAGNSRMFVQYAQSF
ncbi:MAG: translocation/assembly module TamB domain-containing protein [Armatimonadota bacterium]